VREHILDRNPHLQRWENPKILFQKNLTEAKV
jgi:hypothetical protein